GGGAGIQAAQELVKRGVRAVITGRVGPNAAAVLQAAGIKLYTAGGKSVQEAYRQFLNNELAPLTGANAMPHAGIRGR
ncbi:MAG: NifB/NifX family molybdenum-iron cluster-binding protein, partial [Moorella sp. (in: Bacteria)]|nr:NifB/NifX family molybdenum-iron cluster-binding protein [Moorella sp. (in: firmicutes)]